MKLDILDFKIWIDYSYGKTNNRWVVDRIYDMIIGRLSLLNLKLKKDDFKNQLTSFIYQYSSGTRVNNPNNYFNEYTEEIKKIFRFDKILDEENTIIANDILENKSVSLHIRRGDFLLKKNHNHCVDLTKYYSEAIDQISKNFNKPKFFIFTDDPEWVTQNFSIISNFKVVNANKNINSFIDMYLMSLCKGNIIANSSFSWWGAWLNNNKDKIIFAPKKWFNDKSIKTNSLFLKTWNVI